MPETMPQFWDDDASPSYLKGGFLGFQGTGKSLTSVLLAIVARTYFKLDGPLAIYDTESGSGYLRDLILKLTGKPPLVKRARSFKDLVSWGEAVMQAGASVGIADSVTHPWRELCESYLTQINDRRRAWCKREGKSFNEQKKLEFQDWNVIKPTWSKWTDFFLNAPVHMIVAGRAGFDYDMEEDEETHKKELVKTGIKMKTEGEFGYEPSLLVNLVLDRKMVRNRQTNTRRGVVLKDRFMILDGKVCDFPSTDDPKKALAAVERFFLPHLEKLTPGTHVPVDTKARTDFEMNDEGDSGWQQEKRERTILAEEIEGVLVEAYPGQTKEEKQTKARLLYNAFGTYSWTAVQSLHSEILRKGLGVIRHEITERRVVGAEEKAITPALVQTPATEPGASEAAAEFTDEKGRMTAPTPQRRARKE